MVCNFSIKDLEKLSGIKAHTLRIWEQRYGILKPTRSDTNIRNYCNEELKNILNVSLLNTHGYKISKIAVLTRKEIAAEVTKIVDAKVVDSEQITSLIVAMVEMDEVRFEKIISNTILKKGFSYTIEEVVYPFLHKIGVMWHTGNVNPAQEHFITNLIRQKMISAIDGLVAPENKKAKKFILYLPDHELHELSLLYFNYLLKSKGHLVIYLGQSVTMFDLHRVFEIRKSDYIVSVFTHAMESPEAYIKELSKKFSKTKLLLSGHQVFATKMKFPANVALFKTPNELLTLLA
jgi:MerR family transcriptional regulator, light-induced transcriptional regulator